jgi:uncharacterized membrane protein
MKHVAMTDTAFTSDTNLGPSARRRRRPLHRMLVAFSAAYFAGALVTDLVYWQMPDVMWERFSIWLIVAGVAFAGLAVIAYAIDLAGGRRIDRPVWPRVVGYAIAILLAVTNAFVHSRDGYTAVVPTGLMFSGSVIVVLLVTALVCAALTKRHRIGG